MKRMISLVLAAMALFILAACSSYQEPTVPSTAATNPTARSSQPATEAATEPPAEIDPKLGSYQEGTYTNSFLGIGCNLDAQWTVYDEDQLVQLNGITADAVDNEELAEILRNSGVVRPFFALADKGLVTVSITMENLGLLYGTVMDEAAYANLSVDQLPAALESAGLSDAAAEVTTVSFAGTEHAAINIHAAYNNVDFYEVMVYLRQDSYMTAVTVSSCYEDTTAELLSLFYPLTD